MRILIRNTALIAAAFAVFVISGLGIQHAPAQDHSFYTPGNATVPGYVAMCTASSGLAVPCSGFNNAGAALGNTPIVPNTALPVAPNPYPLGATAITADANGTTGTIGATLGSATGKTTYMCGFSINAAATVATNGIATVVNTISTGWNIVMGVATSPSVTVTQQTFSPCVPATNPGLGIAINSFNAGAGENISVNAWGYQL